ncbi:MAG TPA: four-carbon acid sugar kinase family protein [Acidobacteriota bacterium]|jgi:uncharacterized protein YgbK (DUF1537 family)|nr:four-carbon acid sugar kinase family protein [Acidobacteriota bacterium]
MRKVLADDFSGAAEIAGVGFRYAMAAAVSLENEGSPGAELSVVDLDSRSKSQADAVRLIESVLNEQWVFKKIDSALRGHVLAELQPFLRSGRYARALVVAFNPDLGRTIKDGAYRIHGRPISQTAFRDDPEYPALTSDVTEILHADPGTIKICRLSDRLPDRGIVIGEGETSEDLHAWAARIDESTLPAGGAPFFAAWLESRGRRANLCSKVETASENGSKAGSSPTVLVISGTTSRVVDWRGIRRGSAVRVLPMPAAVFEAGCGVDETGWPDDVVGTLDDCGFAVASIGERPLLERSHSPRLLRHLADLAALVLERRPVYQLWLEGGATAAAVVRALGWKRLDVVAELAPGVVRLRPASGGPFITVKPGSYPWMVEV